jgi:two-component system invasion response regulator UvrY
MKILIVDELSLSVKAIRTYRARLLEKLKVRNTAEITRYVLERGLS